MGLETGRQTDATAPIERAPAIVSATLDPKHKVAIKVRETHRRINSLLDEG